MSNESQILVRMFQHNLWANDEMLAACGGLSEAQLAIELAGTYGRLDQTLVHLARAQGGYVRRLTGWEPGPEHTLEYEDHFPGTDAISRHLRFTGDRLVEFAATISADQELSFVYDGRPQRLPAWVVLLQAAYHATEHRQQVATILTGLGIEPPEPDLWAYWDEINPGA
jgi:uncharacterized damage-inducible protein DinB